MLTVRLIKNWNYPDWRRMTPGGMGVWENIKFVDEPVENPDYVVVLNQPSEDMSVVTYANRVWAVIQEPPTSFHRYLHRGQQPFSRIYTSDMKMIGRDERYRASQPALPWHVDCSFDDLIAQRPIPRKTKDLSWITSTLSFLPGHRSRNELIRRVRNSEVVELFGRGVRPIENKWLGLAPYRYSIVFENFIGPHYWSEKLADCFLAGCMPIYVGCSNLTEYFPEGSFIRLDPNISDPLTVLSKIVKSDRAERGRDSIIEARRRCLFKYQLFPFIAGEIAADTNAPGPREAKLLRSRKLRHPIHLSHAVWYWKIRPLLNKFKERLS